MTQRVNRTGALDEKVLLITRTFEAPRDKVWKAWTNKNNMVQWGGPRPWPMVECESDPREDGEWNATLRHEDGKELKQHGIYREVKKPERLVFTFVCDNAHTMPNVETLVTIILKEQGKQTKMIFKQEGFDSVEERDGHNSGWTSAFDRLDEYLKAA